ncbi:MAG: hypothetical protein HDR98_07740 [Bacteroides sp.]|nr:hypothetical protein [Bacteroides sp.]
MQYKSLPILSGVLALIMAGCSSEEIIQDITPIIPSYTSDGIEICGGRPTGISLSRASEPAASGYCEADKIDFRIYRMHSGTISQPDPEIGNLSLNSVHTEDVTQYSGAYSQNKSLNWGYNGTIDKSYVTAFYIPALAYSQADADLFSCPEADTPDKMTLSLKELKDGNYITPEVYFGRLSFTTGDKTLDDNCNMSQGIQWYKRGLNGLGSDFAGTFPVGGKLYRIVSGLTAQITDVNPNIVGKMEMYLSNIPTEISLYGNHGAFYPVGAASGDAQHTKIASGDNDIEWIKVAESDDMGAGTMNLSTFLLPSVEGRSLMIRLYFAPGVIKDGDEDVDSGMSVHTRDYVIRAPKSVFLTGEDAEVYLNGAPDELKGGNGVYLYNVSANSFYSYSNVRINLKGSFDDFFTSNQEVDFDIEVCPSFDRVHNDIEIDY